MKHEANKMQSETADFAPDADTWQTGRNIRFVCARLLCYVKKPDLIY